MNNNMKKLMILVVMVAAFALPTMAQNYEAQQLNTSFQSTSTMMGSGSAYSSNPTINENGTASTPSYSPIKGGPRRGYDANGNWTPDSDDFGGGAETGESNQFPLGDAVMPLTIMALAFCGYVAIRRRKTRA